MGDSIGLERWGQTLYLRDEWLRIDVRHWVEGWDEANGHLDGVYRPRASRSAGTPLATDHEICYLRRVTWSQTVAPPPPIAAPSSAPFLPPTAAPTPAPTPADEPMMIALLATDRVFFTGRSS